MSGDWRIGRASAASAARLAALISATVGDTWDTRFVASLLHLPGTFAFAAEGEGALAGCVLARAAAGEAEILMLVVAPEARRQGLGAALLARALETAAAMGAREIHLEVSASNTPAQALYSAAGFAASGRRVRYYKDGVDALVLRRALAPE